jgi:tRNA A-37 threonylcarbamoyl transferase component Bud32
MMPDTAAPPPGAPQSIGPWTIESQVGSGGMGVVYRATRRDRIAALKVIRPGLLDDLAVQARFEREVEVLRRVRDVHISEFLDADLAGDPAWLATAFIDGPTLRDYVGTQGPLPETIWWRLAQGLAQALAVLEVHGITHRDMKPANVIMADNGPVLIDFGIAMPEDAQSLTGTGLVTGSPSWLSPEQANLQPISTASDVFSLGSLLTFAGTGRPPFGQGANVAVLLAISTKEPDTAGMSEAQRDFVRLLMAKDPTARPSAREVLAMTKRRGADLPPVPVAPAANLTGPQAATQVLAPDAPTSPQAAVDATVAAPAPPAPPAPPPGKRGLGWLVGLAVVLAAVLVGLWFLFGQSDGEDPIAEPEPSETPTAGPAPSAPPPGESTSSGDFALAGWEIVNAPDGTMSVETTVQNNGDEAADGFATVYIYADGALIGTAFGQLPEIPAGGSQDVTLVGQDQWQPGQKSVALDVQ